MKTIFIIVAILASIPLYARNNIKEILSSIEENNTTLKTLREEVKAQHLGNRTGIYLANPELEFNYLWGRPGNVGSRKDFSVRQTFDIPTVTGMKSRLADDKNRLVDLQYKSDRLNILLEAKQYCIDLVYYNALRKELELRLRHARTIADAYQKRLNQGDVNVLEYNKIQLNLSVVQGELSRVNIERNILLSDLKRLNGRIDIVFEDSSFENVLLPADFETWYISAEENNPVLQYVRQEIEVGRSEIKLSKASGLPDFSVGYMSENTTGQNYKGISFGVSIPLWGNKNRVKQAKANVVAAEARQVENKQQFYDQLRNLYTRADGLKQTADNYRKSLTALNNTELLMKALNAGEISLLDYIVEIGLYYDMVNQTLAAERDFEKAQADLSAVEL